MYLLRLLINPMAVTKIFKNLLAKQKFKSFSVISNHNSD